MENIIKSIIIIILAILLYELISILAFNVPSFKPVGEAMKEFSLSDIYTKWEREITKADTLVNEDIVIVNAKNLTRRDDIAKLINEVSSLEPRVIGVDITFNEPKESKSDSILSDVADSVKESVVFACKLTDYDKQAQTFTHIVKPFFTDKVSGIQLGYDNLNADLKGTSIRKMSYKQSLDGRKTMLSLPAAMAKLDGNSIPEQKKNFWINYSNTTFSIINSDELYKYADLITGRLVIIGVFDEEEDMHLSPLGKTPGVLIQAYALNTLLSHKQVTFTSTFWCWVIAIIIALALEFSLISAKFFVSSRKVFMKTFLSESLLLNRLIIFFWLGFVGVGSFLLFWKLDIYVETILPLALVAFVPEMHRLLNSFIDAWQKYKGKA